MIEEAKQRELQMQNKLKSLEQKVGVLKERDQEVKCNICAEAVKRTLIKIRPLSLVDSR